jgi:hypothetical protein
LSAMGGAVEVSGSLESGGEGSPGSMVADSGGGSLSARVSGGACIGGRTLFGATPNRARESRIVAVHRVSGDTHLRCKVVIQREKEDLQ